MATPKPISLNFFEAILLSYVLLNPAIIPLKQPGVIWRHTFCALDVLKCVAV